MAGGFGTRPKPMVESLLWFVVLLGYKGYFANYFLHQSDVTIDMSNGKMEVLNNSSEPWKITLLDTGIDRWKGKDFVGVNLMEKLNLMHDLV